MAKTLVDKTESLYFSSPLTQYWQGRTQCHAVIWNENIDVRVCGFFIIYRFCSSFSKTRSDQLCPSVEHAQFECVYRLFLDEIKRKKEGVPFSYAVPVEENELLLANYKDFALRLGGEKK